MTSITTIILLHWSSFIYQVSITPSSFADTFKSKQARAVIMNDCSNGTATGQVFDFIHHRKEGLLSGLHFILPVAKLKNAKQKRKTQQKEHE